MMFLREMAVDNSFLPHLWHTFASPSPLLISITSERENMFVCQYRVTGSQTKRNAHCFDD